MLWFSPKLLRIFSPKLLHNNNTILSPSAISVLDSQTFVGKYHFDPFRHRENEIVYPSFIETEE